MISSPTLAVSSDVRSLEMAYKLVEYAGRPRMKRICHIAHAARSHFAVVFAETQDLRQVFNRPAPQESATTRRSFAISRHSWPKRGDRSSERHEMLDPHVEGHGGIMLSPAETCGVMSAPEALFGRRSHREFARTRLSIGSRVQPSNAAAGPRPTACSRQDMSPRMCFWKPRRSVWWGGPVGAFDDQRVSALVKPPQELGPVYLIPLGSRRGS